MGEAFTREGRVHEHRRQSSVDEVKVEEERGGRKREEKVRGVASRREA